MNNNKYIKSHSTIDENILKSYINSVFVETGVWDGDGLIAAKNAGFTKIYSIELDAGLAYNAKVKFPDCIIIQGDSRICLSNLISYIDEPITFFLDAHTQLPTQFPYYTTVLEELAQIKEHINKYNDIILIDDIRLFKNRQFPVDINVLIDTALQLKNNITINLIDSTLFLQDIMVIK